MSFLNLKQKLSQVNKLGLNIASNHKKKINKTI